MFDTQYRICKRICAEVSKLIYRDDYKINN